MGATEDVRYGNLDYEGAANLHRWEMKNGKKVLLGCCPTAVSSGALHSSRQCQPFCHRLGGWGVENSAHGDCVARRGFGT
ncbi:unnamed protein product [Sphagnum jensenii]|uniref:Uncharacterized protein n=1 Tax=Sphagnum jensenii TaxID=128206 RepID=A0ABP1BS25_9BRYO